MLEVLAIALASAAIVLSYGADGPRDVPRWALLRTAGRARAARALALALIGMALAAWNISEPGPAAFLAVPLALLAAGTLFTLAAPVLGAVRARRSDVGERTASRAPRTSERPGFDVDALTTTRTTFERALLVLSVTVGPLPVALLASAAIARFLPVSADARYATGFGLAIPLWQVGMCIALLARRGAPVFGVCAALSAALAGLVFGIQP